MPGLVARSPALRLSVSLASAANAEQHEHSERPKAERLLDKHVEATGGEEAHLAIKSCRNIGTLEVKMTGHEFVAKVKSFSLSPGGHHLSIDGDFLAQVNVCDGENAWVWMPGHAGDHGDSTTLRTGEERADTLATADLRNIGSYGPLYIRPVDSETRLGNPLLSMLSFNECMCGLRCLDKTHS